MSKDEESPYLLFGQGILIEGQKNDEDKGLLTTKGYADVKAKYETYQNILYFQNYRDASFEIIPAGNFEIHDEILKDYPSKGGLQQKDKDNLIKLQKRAETQARQFKLGTQINMKSNVLFGTDVMFKHLDSQAYLCGTIEPSQGDNGAFAVKVSNDLSSELIWKLLPYRSFESNGMPIPFGSPITIKNVSNSTFLTFEKRQKAESTQPKLNQKAIKAQDQSFDIPIKKKSENSKIYSCVSHSNDLSDNPENQQAPMPWKFKLHMNDVVNEKLIQHDIVYFEHSQNKGVLTAFKNTVALKQSKNPSWALSSYDCLWEIEKYQQQNFYILRHLMSGMTFSFIEKQSPDGKKKTVPMLTEIASAQHLGTVQIRIATKQTGQINSNSKVHFFKDNLVLDIVPLENKKAEKNQQYDKINFIKQKIIQQNFDDFIQGQRQYIKKDLWLTQQEPKNCFIIMEIDDDTQKQVLFALSFHQTLISLIDELRWGTVWAQKKITYQRMIALKQSLQQIKGFIKNCPVAEAKKQEILPIQKRQTICKDLGMSELLFSLLYYMKINKKQNIFQSKHNEKQKFDDLYNLCYEVIQIMVKNHLLFKIHVSRWIDFVIDDVLQNDSLARLNALMQILQGNYLIIQNFITPQFIQHFFKQFRENQQRKKEHQNQKWNKGKYIKILRALCIVNGKAITKNQTYILNEFIRKCQGSKYWLNFKIQKQILTIQVLNNNNSHWRQFTDYYKSVTIDDKGQMWYYFIEYMHLLADLCYGRNKSVKNYLMKAYQLSILNSLLNSPSVNEAYVPVLRLIQYLYVEGKQFYPITMINRILKYEDIVPQPSINTLNREGKYWDPQLKTLLDNLKKILDQSPRLLRGSLLDKTQYPDIEQKITKMNNDNQKLKIILKTILTTIELGYWTSLEDLIDIMKKMEVILQNDPLQIKVETQQIKAQFRLPSKKNKILIDCQQIAAQIIEKIKIFEADIQMRQTCFVFKQLVFTGGVPNNMLKGSAKQSLEAGAFRVNQQKVKQWIAKLNQIEQARSPSLDQKNISRILVQLSQYNNPKLISQSLSIMKKIYDSRQDNINNFSQLTLVDSGECLQWYQYITKRAQKFFVLEDQNTLKIRQDTQSEIYFNINKDSNQTKQQGIMQDLYMFWQLMKNQNKISTIKNNSLNLISVFDLLASERLINLSSQRETNNKLNQKIMKSTQIHLLVLNYIMNCQQYPKQILAAKLLHLCYIFLTGLIVNNQDIKLEIEQHMPQMKVHLNRNVGAIDFFKQMYDNNKNMLYNQNEIQRLTSQICNIINELPQQSYYRSKLLDFFRSLIFFNDKNLKFNQIRILKIMQDDTYSYVLNPVNKQNKQQLEKLIEQFEESNVANQDEFLPVYIKISAQLTYTYTFFQTMAGMIQGNNIVNIGKLVKRHPFQMLVQYIEVSKKCWPLRRNIRVYLNKLYYNNSGLQCYSKTILDKQLDNIIFDLNSYIQSKISSKSSEFEKQMIENPVRFTYMQSYLYLNLEQVLYTLFEIMHHKGILDIINEYVSMKTNKVKETDQLSPSLSLAYKLLMITQRLGYLRNFFKQHKCIYTCHLIKYIQGKMRLMIRDWPDFVFEIHPSQKSMKNDQKINMRKMLINRLIAGDIGSVYSRMNKQEEKIRPLTYQLFDDKNQTYRRDPEKRNIGIIEEQIRGKLTQILSRGKKYQVDRNKDLQEMLLTILNTVKLSKQFNQNTKKNFLEKANLFSNIDKDSQQVYGEAPYISKQEYIKIIIEMNSKSSDVLSSDLKIFFLKLLTRSISEKNENDIEEGKPVDQWDTTYWDGMQIKISEQQNKMVKCGLATFLCGLLSADDITDNIFLANQILICGIAFILGGYQQSQASILDILKNDEDNKVFENIEKLIKKLGDLIYKNNQKKIVVQKDNNRTFATNRCDNYDHYDVDKRSVVRKNVYEPDNAKQQQYKNTCITTFRRAFKFIQLLCENNNNEGKNFIREQKTKEGTKKLNSINFIQLATNELRDMTKIFCTQTRDIPIFIMDFINEVTQIPVRENQLVLMRSTFFEDLCAMQQYFSKQSNLRQRQIGQQGVEALAEIYSKTVSIILSNFEGNENDTFSLLDDKLESKFLINILDQNIRSAQLINLPALKANLKQSKQYTFSQPVQNMINILCIFKKMQQKLPNGKLILSFNQYKLSLKDKLLQSQQGLDKQNLQPAQSIKQPQKQQKVTLMSHYTENQTQQSQEQLSLLLPSSQQIQEPDQAIKQQNEDLFSVIEYLQKRILKIQITGENSSNQIIYFPKHPVFNSLSQQLRDQIMLEVERQSHREKIVSLFKCYDKIKDNIQHSFDLQKNQGITQKYINSVKYFSCAISIVITIILMLNYNIVIQYQSAEFYLDNFLIRILMKLLSFTHLGTLIYYFTLWKKMRVSGDTSKYKDEKQPVQSLSQPFYKDAAFVQQAIFFTFSVLGTFYQPYLFTLQLLDIFLMIDVLKDIFTAIAMNIQSLAIVSVMGVAFMFIFCLIGFSNYMKNIYEDQDIDQMCGTVSSCILDMYVSGVVGQTSGKFDFTRFSYQSVYFVFFGLLFGNIISGIMINSFALKRQIKDALIEDKSNFCYICNINRDAIQKTGQTFEKHTRSNHFLWNYIFYKYTLERKDPTQYTGLEYYINNKIYKEEVEIDWIPDDQRGKFDIEQSIQNLNQAVKQFSENMMENISQLGEKIQQQNKNNSDYSKNKIEKLEGKIDDIKRTAGQFLSPEQISQTQIKLEALKKLKDINQGQEELISRLEYLSRDIEQLKKKIQEGLRNKVRQLQLRWQRNSPARNIDN